MQRAARKASRLLEDSAARVIDFLRLQRTRDGGFRGRGAGSDLYYTLFTVEALDALGAPCHDAPLAAYLHAFGAGEALDAVHLACLARLRAATGAPFAAEARERIRGRALALRARDGGWGSVPGAAAGTAYAAFLMVGLLEDLGCSVDDPGAVCRALETLRAADGGYGNTPGCALGQTPSTAAAVTVRAALGAAMDARALEWLLARVRPGGGFEAVPGAPCADLLSTATALHALCTAGAPIGTVREACMDYLDCLWRPEGGFRGHAADRGIDGEYTYYGLLALGHLDAGG